MKSVSEFAKPSVLETSSIFSKIRIAILDRDHKTAVLVKKLLSGLGCDRIYILSDAAEVLRLMKEEHLDIIVTEWEAKTLGGVELARHLRQSPESPNRMIPIIMLTGRNSHADISAARDAGINEFLVKPFSAKTLLDRLYSVVENPRGFVICQNFIGPDRRRVSSLTLPENPEDSKTLIERRPPVIITLDQAGDFMPTDVPRMLVPDFTLKKKLDLPPEFIRATKAVEATANAIEDSSAEFMQWMLKDVNMLEQSLELLMRSPDHVRRLILVIREASLSIRNRAGVFGYTRASEVAGMLYSFCDLHYNPENKYHLIIIEKHIQTIGVIFGQKIKGDGGEVGALLVHDLGKLTEKYLHSIH